MLRRIVTKELLPFWILSIAYLGTRLTNLLLLPLFTDESIYIYWAKIIATSHAQVFISLTDGKPPLLIWMISVLLSIFPSDWYLLAGRLPSVMMGFISLIAVIHITTFLFTKRAGILAGFLYIISPMSLFYDRMALFDSMLTAMLLVAVYFALRTGKFRLWRDALLWGFFLGLAFLSKPTALLFLPLTVFAAILAVPNKDVKNQWKKVGILSLVAVILGEGINSIQRLSSAYPAMIRKNQQFQQPIAELLANPFALTIGNLQGFFSWTVAYYTIPLLLIGIVSFAYGLLKKSKNMFLLGVLWFIPLLLLATVGREVFPRYILIVVPYFLMIAAFGIDQALMVKNTQVKKLVTLGLIIVSMPILIFDYLLLTDPAKAPLPVSDANQYVFEHPSGYGLEEVYTYLRESAKDEPVTVVTQGTFGLYPYAFYLEFWGDPSISVLPKWPLESLDEEIIQADNKGKALIILKEYEEVPPGLPVTEVFRATKPGGKFPILVTERKDIP